MPRSLTSRAAVGVFLLAVALVPLIGNKRPDAIGDGRACQRDRGDRINLLVGYGGIISSRPCRISGRRYTAAILGLWG